jgi:ABC-2 type transport system ATP-binding protein
MRGSRKRGRLRRSVWVWNSFYQRRDGGGWTAWLEPLDGVERLDDVDAEDGVSSPLVVLAFGDTPHAARKDLIKQIARRLKESPGPEADAFRQRHARLFEVGEMPVVEWPPPVAFHSVMQVPSKVVKDHELVATIASSDDMAVALQHVSKSYGAVEAVRGITVTIPKGQVVAVLGPNGAGKTTTIHMMLGLRRPTKGMATLFGQPPTSLAARARCGVMLQESGLPATLRVGEVVDLFRSYYAEPMARDEVLDLAGIAHKRKSLVTRLSGGERQRLYFALAVCGDPEALFLDEPTAGLDVEARQAFLASVRGFAALGKTVVMTTHYLEEAEAVADRIIVINRGRVVADGSPASIKTGFGKKRVSFAANVAVPELAFCDLPVAGLEVSGRRVRFLADAPEVVLRTLFDRGIQVEDLEVTAAGLQEAFLALVESGSTKGQAVA